MVELVARLEGRDLGKLGPPDEETLEAVHDVERAVIGSLTDGCQMSGSEGEEGAEVPRGLPTRTMRLTVSEDTARFWRTLERTFAGIFVSGHLDLVHGGHLQVIGDAGIGGVLRWEASGWRAVGRDAGKHQRSQRHREIG